MVLKVLELFSGIGGMHYAMQKSGVLGDVIAALEINNLANEVYKHNFPTTKLMNNNVQKLNEKIIKNMNVNCILMSPPCQPFSLQKSANFNDIRDHRADPFNHICDLLSVGHLSSINYILMENVKGFEKSEARRIFLEALKKAGFHYQEFNLSPTSLGVPNTRHRYYCIARRSSEFQFFAETILEEFPNHQKPETLKSIKDFLQIDIEESKKFYLSDKILEQRFGILAISSSNSSNCMCFTKNYSRYLEGTGSVYTDLSEEDLASQIKILEASTNEAEKLCLKKKLQLRFFGPTEVAKLMSFPAEFKFPVITDKQKYRLLGNSINVAVVGKLINLMVS